MTSLTVRTRLMRAMKYLALLFGGGILYVSLDFLIDIRPPAVHSSYQFNIPELEFDQPLILNQDNLAIVVVRRSPAIIAKLAEMEPGALQDPRSRHSSQPGFAQNPLRSFHAEYFVGYAIGTDFGCPLETDRGGFKEICGQARYDYAGRALEGEKSFKNLAVPDYNFSRQFSKLTIKP